MIAKEGRDFNQVIKEIIKILDRPISGEVKATTTLASDVVVEGHEIARMHPDMIIKIPLMAEGLKAVSVLSKEKIKTNFILIFSTNQALLAAVARAT